MKEVATHPLDRSLVERGVFRRAVLRLFLGRGLIDEDQSQGMPQWPDQLAEVIGLERSPSVDDPRSINFVIVSKWRSRGGRGSWQSSHRSRSRTRTGQPIAPVRRIDGRWKHRSLWPPITSAAALGVHSTASSFDNLQKSGTAAPLPPLRFPMRQASRCIADWGSSTLGFLSMSAVSLGVGLTCRGGNEGCETPRCMKP